MESFTEEVALVLCLGSELVSSGRQQRVDRRITEPMAQSCKRVRHIRGITLFLLWLGLKIHAKDWGGGRQRQRIDHGHLPC